MLRRIKWGGKENALILHIIKQEGQKEDLEIRIQDRFAVRVLLVQHKFLIKMYHLYNHVMMVMGNSTIV